MPKELQPGVLYVSEEFGTAAHLCPCGCGSKVRTPLSPAEWTLTVVNGRPSLSPSVGNWQKPCQSHYWIRDGEVRWSGSLTPAEIAGGRRAEHERRIAYYETSPSRRFGGLRALWEWVKRLVGR